MMAIFIMTTLFFLILSGLTIVSLSKQMITTQLVYHGQAVNAARAGLVDSMSWFRRQSTQPVALFDPKRDLALNPPINDTDDEAIGIVRDYEISELGSVWGRFEVRKTRARDASAERGKPGTGAVWQIDSIGIVYVRKDANSAFDQYPNYPLVSATARTEIQRLNLVLPGNAAICAARGDGVDTEAPTRILGGTDMGILYPAATGAPTVGGAVAGNPSTGTVDPYLDSIESVFGVSQRELISMADVVAMSVNDLPPEFPAMSLAIVKSDATFDASHPLVGNGILVVLGDTVIESDSFSNFNGLIYVTGDYEQNSPSQISGAIVVQGDVDIKGGGDFSEVNYDGALLAQIQNQMSQYRFSRSALLVQE